MDQPAGVAWCVSARRLRRTPERRHDRRRAPVSSSGRRSGPALPWRHELGRARRTSIRSAATPPGGRLTTWELAAYRAEIKNELQCVFSSFAVILKSLWVGGPSPDKLWLNLAYTLNDFRFDGDTKCGDKILRSAPRHFLRSEQLYKHSS